MQSKKFLLWDHDGVLVDTEKWYFLATQACLAELGVEFDQAGYLSMMADGRTYWDRAQQRGIADSVIAAARRKRDELYQQYLLTREIEIEGVIEVLSELTKTHRMAIVTTSRREDFDLIHRSRTIRRFFEFVIAAEDCTRHKPDPDPYQQALRRFDAEPGEALAIEDSSRGLRSAVAAGLDCVIIRNDFTAAQDFARAWRVLSSIRELPTVLVSK
jgi:HAD superfamily hydrolase (TIGR01509 family)